MLYVSMILFFAAATILNIDLVREVVPQPGGQGQVRPADSRTVDVSRPPFRELIERLDGR